VEGESSLISMKVLAKSFQVVPVVIVTAVVAVVVQVTIQFKVILAQARIGECVGEAHSGQAPMVAAISVCIGSPVLGHARPGKKK
jgi:hypothetical protein